MKKVIILIAVIVFFIATPFVCKAKNVDVTSDGAFYNIEQLFLYSIIKDMSFLEKTKPANWEALIKDLGERKYIRNYNETEELSIYKFYKNGGDCDDFAVYTIARLFQLNKSAGILILKANNPKSQSHIVAITMTLNKKDVLVIDAASKNKEHYVTSLMTYIDYAIKTKYFKSCRIMWLYKGSTPGKIFNFPVSEKSTK